MFETIDFEVNGAVATIKMKRPDILNPLDITAGMEIRTVLEDLSSRHDVRVLVIRGSGRAYSAGGDIKGMLKAIEDNTPGDFMDELTSVLYGIGLKLRRLAIPVVSVVTGHAVGAGMNMALCSDFIIASEDAKFSQGFTKLGLIPGFGGTYLLARQVTWQRACEIAFLGESISASEMKELGFVNRVVSMEKIEEALSELTVKLISGPALAFERTKELFLESMGSNFQGHLEYERKVQIQSARSDEFKEGVSALNEKRKPLFNKS